MSSSGNRSAGRLLARRRADTQERLARLRAELKRAERIASGKACVYLTGSFGRGEASRYSDLDLFIVGKGTSDQSALPRLDEIRLQAELIDTARRLRFPEFSRDGMYLEPATVGDLLATLGTPEDDAANTFTARLLLLLESRPLIGPRVYADVIGQVIEKYWLEFRDHRSDFVPAFLTNDILRLWRTFCVNYEAGTEREPAAKRAKRKLKNYKLKHSRLLTCYSGLVFLLATYAERKTVTPLDARRMVELSPTGRLAWLRRQKRFAGCRDIVDELLERYEAFLENTGAPEAALVERFARVTYSRRLAREVGHFGDLMWRLLREVGGDSPFLRMLVV